MINCTYHLKNEGKFICFSALCKNRYQILCEECVGSDYHLKHQYCKIQELFEKINAQKVLKRMKNEEILKEIVNSGNNLCERIQEQINKLNELKSQLSKSISTIVSHFTVHLDIDTGMDDDDPASRCTTNQDIVAYLSNIIDFQSYSFDFSIDSKQNFLGVQLNNIKNLFSSERFQFYKYPLEDLKERISEVRKYSNQINQSQNEFEISLRKKSTGSKTASNSSHPSASIKNNELSTSKKQKQLNHSDHNLYHHKTRKLSMLLKDSLFGNIHNANLKFQKGSKTAVLKVCDNLNFQNILTDFTQELENDSIQEVKILIFEDKETVSNQDINKIIKKLQHFSNKIITFQLQANTKVLKMFDNERVSNWLNKNCHQSLKALDYRVVFTKVNEYENYLNILQQLNLQNLNEIHLNYILSSINKYEGFMLKHQQLKHINLDILYSLPSQVEEFFEAFFQNQIKNLTLITLYLNFNVKNGQKGIEYLSSFSLDCSYLPYLQKFLQSQKDSLQIFQISDNVRFNSSLPLEESLFTESLNMPQLKSFKVKFNLIGEEDAKNLLTKIERLMPLISECHLFPEFDTLYENSYVKKLKTYQYHKIAKVLAILKWKFINFSQKSICDIFEIVYNQQKIFGANNSNNA